MADTRTCEKLRSRVPSAAVRRRSAAATAPYAKAVTCALKLAPVDRLPATFKLQANYDQQLECKLGVQSTTPWALAGNQLPADVVDILHLRDALTEIRSTLSSSATFKFTPRSKFMKRRRRLFFFFRAHGRRQSSGWLLAFR